MNPLRPLTMIAHDAMKAALTVERRAADCDGIRELARTARRLRRIARALRRAVEQAEKDSNRYISNHAKRNRNTP